MIDNQLQIEQERSSDGAFFVAVNLLSIITLLMNSLCFVFFSSSVHQNSALIHICSMRMPGQSLKLQKSFGAKS